MRQLQQTKSYQLMLNYGDILKRSNIDGADLGSTYHNGLFAGGGVLSKSLLWMGCCSLDSRGGE